MAILQYVGDRPYVEFSIEGITYGFSRGTERSDVPEELLDRFKGDNYPQWRVVGDKKKVEEKTKKMVEVIEAPPVIEEPVVVEESTQEVVQNEQENVTTEPAVSSEPASLEERVKMLEEKLKKLIEFNTIVHWDHSDLIRKFFYRIFMLSKTD